MSNDIHRGFQLPSVRLQPFSSIENEDFSYFLFFNPLNQLALHTLWDLSFPNVKLTALVSDQWKDMGWQGPNPATDVR